MKMQVMFTVTIEVQDQGNYDDNQMMATAMAAKCIAENCQFDCAEDVEIPDTTNIQLSFGQ